MNPFFTRHYNILTPELAAFSPITIIGAGAVGSWTALALAKMGFSNITIWDDDKVDEENVGVQLYGPNDLGLDKVEALRTYVYNMSGTTLSIVADKWQGQEVKGIVIAAVDSMSVRNSIWEYVKSYPVYVPYYIDSRMAAEEAQMYVMSPARSKDVESYEKTLYTDEQAMPEPCTAKATSYTAMLLGGIVCKAVKDIVMEQPYARITKWSIKGNDMECYNNVR